MTREKAEVRILRAELLDAHRDLVRVRTQVEQLIASNQDLTALLASTSRQAADRLKVIVAFRRLSEANDFHAMRQALEDVAINVVGTEDFVVLANADGGRLAPIAGMGRALDEARSVAPSLAALRESDGRVVPLYVDDAAVGVLYIRRLLEHRDPLNAADEQVLAILSHFAARAIAASNERRACVRRTLQPVL